MVCGEDWNRLRREWMRKYGHCKSLEELVSEGTLSKHYTNGSKDKKRKTLDEHRHKSSRNAHPEKPNA